MSFLSDLFHGNFGNLGEDIAPSNIFKDFGSSFANQPTWAKALEIALPAVALGGVGLGAIADVGAAGAATEGGLAAADIGAGTAAFADPTAEAIAAAGGAGGGVPLAGLSPSTYFGAAPLADTGAAIPGAAELTSGAANPFIAGTEAVPFYNDPAAGGLPGISMSTGTGPTAGWADAYAGMGSVPGAAGGAGGGGGATTGGDFAAVASAVDTAPPGLTTGITDPAQAIGGLVDRPPPGLTTGGAAGGGGIGGAISSIGSTLKSAAPWLGAAGLGYNLFQGYQSQQALKQLQQQETDYQNRIAQAGQAELQAAGQMLSTGNALIMGGPLPSSVKALFDQYSNSAKAQIIQGYGARNQPTDPLQNSALQQDLSAVDRNVLALQEQVGTQMVNIANQMVASGASATNIAAELPLMMQRLSIQLEQLTGNSIANFAAAMSGGTMRVAGQGTGINLNLNAPNTTTTQTLLGA